MTNVISMKALLESGVHFGHRTNKWNPGMKPYIFTERNGIHIIDLQQTAKSLNAAYALVRDTVAAGKDIMFVGTKRQAQETIRDEAIRCGIPAPAMCSALNYYDAYRTERLSANLLQAQRDYFGAHTYERLDHPRGEFFHTNWTGEGGSTSASTYNA